MDVNWIKLLTLSLSFSFSCLLTLTLTLSLSLSDSDSDSDSLSLFLFLSLSLSLCLFHSGQRILQKTIENQPNIKAVWGISKSYITYFNMNAYLKNMYV
jgi:hypothetical protein